MTSPETKKFISLIATLDNLAITTKKQFILLKRHNFKVEVLDLCRSAVKGICGALEWSLQFKTIQPLWGLKLWVVFKTNFVPPYVVLRLLISQLTDGWS